jgi:hypothetical protein
MRGSASAQIREIWGINTQQLANGAAARFGVPVSAEDSRRHVHVA